MGWAGLSPRKGEADLDPTCLSVFFLVEARPDPTIWFGPELIQPKIH